MARKIIQHEITFPKLDEQLRQLALTDFEKFKRLTQIDMLQIFICEERAKGKTIRQIAQYAKVTRSVVETRCKKCPNCSDRK